MILRRLSRTLIATALFTSINMAAEAATQIGKVVAVSGFPSASGPGGNRKLSGGSSVFEDDKITVGSGNAQIILNDNTRLVVGPGSSLVLDRFLMKGGKSAQKVSIKALRGTFRFISGRSPKSAYNITTPSATIGIRGTGFDFWTKGRTGVAVMNGNVNLCSGGDCVNLDSSCELGTAGGGAADELTGGRAGNQIISNLPYIINQSPLNSRFHLNTGRCSSTLLRAKQLGNLNDGSRADPPPPPEPPPPPPCQSEC